MTHCGVTGKTVADHIVYDQHGSESVKKEKKSVTRIVGIDGEEVAKVQKFCL